MNNFNLNNYCKLQHIYLITIGKYYSLSTQNHLVRLDKNIEKKKTEHNE